MNLKKIIYSFFYSLTIPVLSILYAGLIVSTIICMLAGILRTFGFEQIKMSIWSGIDLPVALSIPFAIIVSLFLIIGSLYVKRLINFCISNLKSYI
ncbi:hypothetical protein [Siminovitchia fordii]|uniref:Uncharacterized protein n=1 Tax=Siminovitchia fordii TaxID=254759 RepID=A0ABQ4KE28_9BACI|nr:hypothetical protein [Siminovitchia fordii]GIN23327.1 hypothetical protein J1TS3_44610 [Siminovitchia fordii]